MSRQCRVRGEGEKRRMAWSRTSEENATLGWFGKGWGEVHSVLRFLFVRRKGEDGPFVSDLPIQNLLHLAFRHRCQPRDGPVLADLGDPSHLSSGSFNIAFLRGGSWRSNGDRTIRSGDGAVLASFTVCWGFVPLGQSRHFSELRNFGHGSADVLG